MLNVRDFGKNASKSIVFAALLATFTPAFADGSVNSTVTDSVLDLRPEDVPNACDATVPQIRVTVNGVSATGILAVEVYNDDTKNFLSKEGRIKRVRVAAVEGRQTVCVNVPGAGIYAVASYHDLDADRKLDRRWNFLPKEPFALSNDPKLKLRKPRHREAAFTAGRLGADITVNLRGSKPDR
jgi:uncharacterized protein (DUF2141 family)